MWVEYAVTTVCITVPTRLQSKVQVKVPSKYQKIVKE